MNMSTQDLRQALRIFRREPALAATAVLTLTLGIGTSTTLFAVVEAALLRPLPFADADRLVVLRHRDTRTGLAKPDIAIGDFVDLRARQRSLEAIGGFAGYQSTYFGTGEPLRVDGAVATADALQALGTRPALGRLLRADDARPGAPPVALVSHAFWQARLGSDPLAIARSIQLGTARVAVVGVLPAGFRMPGMPRTDVVVTQPLPAAAPAARKAGWIYGVGRLRAGRTVAMAGAELATLSGQLAREFPDQNTGTSYEVLALRDALLGDTEGPLLLLLAAVGCVLLIACANVGNLMLARALGRQQELAVRLALGASRARLAAQILAEGLVLAVAGGLAGIAIAWWAAPIVAARLPSAAAVPGLAQVGIDGRVALFALAAAVGSALLLSAVACLGVVRSDRGALVERRATMTPRARRAASALVVVEIALATVLLAGAGLTIRSLANLLAVDPGFRADGVLTVQLSLPDGRYQADDARRAFYTRAMREIDALPDVEAIGAAMVTPLTGNNWTVPLRRIDRPVPQGERAPDVGWQMASHGYFAALGIPLRTGRLFAADDGTGPAAVVVSESVAARFFPGEQAVGHRLDLGDTQAEIVGVVGDVRRASLTDTPRADLYFPFERVYTPSTTLFIRTTGDPVRVLPAVRAIVRRIEPHAVIDETRTLAAIAADSAAVTRLATHLLGGFAGTALVLAAVGIYGVMAYRVRRRTRELGTRLALGATPARLARLVLRQAGGMALVGVVLGAGVAAVATRALSSLLFGVTPWDPLTLAGAAALLAAVTVAASWLPARRAARVDPVASLAAE
jgi:putative ABC transport system permease protein